MSRRLVTCLPRLCDEIYLEKITPDQLRDCLFFFNESREESFVLEDTPPDLADICTCLPPGKKQRIFDEIILPAITLAEQEDRCRWLHDVAVDPTAENQWLSAIEAFLLEHGYPKLFDNPEVRAIRPYCEPNVILIHAIRILNRDLELI